MSKAKKGAVEDATPAVFDPTVMIKIVSKEGHEFIVDRNCAKVSKLLKNYLAGQATQSKEVIFDEEQKDVVHFPTISTKVLEKAIQYWYFKYRYDNDPDHRPQFNVPHEMALELLAVATFLQC